MGLFTEHNGKIVEIYICPFHQTIMKKPNQNAKLPSFCPECRKNGEVIVADLPQGEFEEIYGQNWKPYKEPEIEAPKELVALKRNQKILEYKQNRFLYIKVAN